MHNAAHIIDAECVSALVASVNNPYSTTALSSSSPMIYTSMARNSVACGVGRNLACCRIGSLPRSLGGLED
jgi:hypothetical protein